MNPAAGGHGLEKKEEDNQQQDSEVQLIIQKGIQAEAQGRRELEEAYCVGYDDGFRDGLAAGYERGDCEMWDEAYSSGYRAAEEELEPL